MAIVTNAYPTYNSTGKTLKEQLSETISNISPFDTPFMSSIKKEKAKSTKVEWLKDTLATPSTSNAQLEGDTYAATATADVTRLSNMAQISAKSFAITSTQESVDNAGMSTYSAYELAKNSKALKTDMETSLFNNGAQVAGGVGTARSLAGIKSWIGTNSSRGANGADPTALLGAHAPTNGTQRVLSEDLLKGVIKGIWNSGGSANSLYVGSFNKQKISSSFTGGATKQVQADTKVIVGAVDTYISDFGTLNVIPARHQAARDLWVIDHDLWSMATLRDYKVDEMAKTGDAKHFLLTTEYTLCAKNEAGNGVIADLTTA
tara:strand:- start:1208 stop:2164 length:957 start_codon:yes stop_codon:yes gene_type:complete